MNKELKAVFDSEFKDKLFDIFKEPIMKRLYVFDEKSQSWVSANTFKAQKDHTKIKKLIIFKGKLFGVDCGEL